MAHTEGYTSMWAGANLIDTVFMMSVISASFSFLIARIVYPIWSPIEMVSEAFFVMLYIFSYAFLRFYLHEKHRRLCRGVKFLYSNVWRDMEYREKFLFGVKHYSIIPIDLSKEQLTKLFHTNYFQQLKKVTLAQERYFNIHKHLKTTRLTKEDKKKLKKLKKPSTNYDELNFNPIPEEDLKEVDDLDELGEKFSVTKEEKEEKEDREKKDKKKEKKEKYKLQLVEDEDTAIQVIDGDAKVPLNSEYTEFYINEVNTKILKSFNAYSAQLYAEYEYEDQPGQKPWEKIVIIMKGTWEWLLQTRMDFGVHEGYPVSIDQVDCALIQLGWAMTDVPIMLLTWSENLKDMQLIEVLDAVTINYIHMEVLRKMVDNWRAFAKKYELEMRELEMEVETYAKAYDKLIQKWKQYPVNRMKGHQQMDADKLQNTVIKAGFYKKILYVALGVLVILIVVIILFSVGVIPVMQVPTNSTYT